MNNFQSDIVVITALEDPELRAFRQGFKLVSEKPLLRLDEEPGTYRGWLAKGEKRLLLYAASSPRYGMTAAATLTTQMIERYTPHYVALLGLSAGFRDKAELGDILIANQVSNYQEGKLAGGRLRRDYFGYRLDQALETKLKRGCDTVIEQMNKLGAPRCRAHLGTVLTGSQVIASTDTIQQLVETESRKAIGVEMEGVGVFHAAESALGPRPKPMLIKAVSDFGTEDKNDQQQERAAENSSLFFLLFALNYLEPTDLLSPSTYHQVVPWSWQGTERGEERLIRALNRCGQEDSVNLISITGASVFAPSSARSFQSAHAEAKSVKAALEGALRRGAHCRAILLDPDNREAQWRMECESPAQDGNQRLLARDSARVRKELYSYWANYRERGYLSVRYSSVGLAFNLWLLATQARIEPYHFGKLKSDQGKIESPLCGFSQLWIHQEAEEYELLGDHFEKLWRNAVPLAPPQGQMSHAELC